MFCVFFLQRKRTGNISFLTFLKDEEACGISFLQN